MVSGTMQGMATSTSFKVRENRVRRMAERQGLALHKSGRRDPRALDYGTYGLYDANRNVLEVGNPSTGFGLSLEEVERALMEGPEEVEREWVERVTGLDLEEDSPGKIKRAMASAGFSSEEIERVVRREDL